MTEPAPRNSLPQLEKFELLEEIGHGGMATVFRAVDNRLGREVAVKIIHRHLRENKEVATRFLAEARAAAKLKHPGIVEVYDVSAEDDRERFLVVELVRGNTLRKVLQENREMPAEIGVAIAIELCEAIEHAHASGIVHRDIKPENVLVSLPADRPKEGGPTSDDPAKSGPAERPSDPRSGRTSDDDPAKSGPAVPSTARSPKSKRTRDVVIKITDFGIAKVLDAQGVTSTGQVLGSPAHMAPEQIEGGDVDGRTDVFALGVVLYECLVGHLPFEGKNPAQVLRRVLDGKYESAERERPAVGGRYSTILDQALANELKDRLASPAALAQALRDELESLGITEPHAEIAAYFEDPPSFCAELKRRLVPKLVARGEEHRRAGRTPAAACDFNRAHALAPDDLVILKRLTQLSRRDGTRALLRRGAIVAAVSMTLGGAAYGTVRALRNDGAILNPEERGVLDSAGPDPKKVGPEPFPRPTAERPAVDASSAEPHTSASARVAAVPRLGSAAASAGAGQSGDPRPVKFKILPMGAALVVDGAAVDHTSGAPVLLAPGSHTAKLTPQANDKASDGARSISFTVPPLDSDDPKKAHLVNLSLSFKSARVLLLGPPGGQAACGQGVTLTVGAAADIKMPGPVLDTNCQFILGGANVGQGFQSIRAGEDNRIAWPK
ncbi:MAG: serine/threonine protein kinase [Polyangiaceae bacterium]|nr:serine/threonine protein kinase [Polyangiaceae bacterium]